MSVDTADDVLKWNWLYWPKGLAWYAPCIRCSETVVVADPVDDSLVDGLLAQAESKHQCGMCDPDLLLYEEHYGFDGLKRFVGIPD